MMCVRVRRDVSSRFDHRRNRIRRMRAGHAAGESPTLQGEAQRQQPGEQPACTHQHSWIEHP